MKTQLSDLTFSKNKLNILVIRTPVIYQAVMPVTYELDTPAFPTLEGIPKEQESLEAYNQLIENTPGKRLKPLRQGYLYIFRLGKLYAEYYIQFHSKENISLLTPIDLLNEQGKDTRLTDPNTLEEPAPYILIPQTGEYQVAYSEAQWSWLTIQSMGGMHTETPDVNASLDGDDKEDASLYPNLNPKWSLPCPANDDNLVDWSEALGEKLRNQRCQTIQCQDTPIDGGRYPLDEHSQTPSNIIASEIIQQIPGLAQLETLIDTNAPLERSLWVSECVLLPV